MAAVSFLAIQRILYIPTYFLPLFFSFILVFLVFLYIFESHIIKKDKLVYATVFLLVAQIIYAFYISSPVAYAKKITYLECEKTRLVDFWKDHCNR